jgi:hypothetical protein
MIARETLYSSVFSALSAAVADMSFKTLSRREKFWVNVDVNDMPAMFMKQISEDLIPQGKEPTALMKYDIDIDIVIYVYSGDSAVSSAPTLNAAVDRIEQLFKPNVLGHPVNLGIAGVQAAKIKGKISYGEGNLDGQGVALIPIKIITV